MERIEAGLLIPGGGEPVSDGAVIIDHSVISYAGPAGRAPATPTCTPTRCPGSATSPRTRANCGWPTEPPSACAPFASSSGRTPG